MCDEKVQYLKRVQENKFNQDYTESQVLGRPYLKESKSQQVSEIAGHCDDVAEGDRAKRAIHRAAAHSRSCQDQNVNQIR